MTTCQQACQFNPSCNFFTFSKDEEVCILHQVELEDRKCDLILGPPLPSLQGCLNQMQIPWANSSGIECLIMFMCFNYISWSFNKWITKIYLFLYFNGIMENLNRTCECNIFNTSRRLTNMPHRYIFYVKINL